MSFDPQDAPDTWVEEVRRLLSVDGDEFVLVRDQDGVEYLMHAWQYDREI